MTFTVRSFSKISTMMKYTPRKTVRLVCIHATAYELILPYCVLHTMAVPASLHYRPPPHSRYQYFPHHPCVRVSPPMLVIMFHTLLTSRKSYHIQAFAHTSNNTYTRAYASLSNPQNQRMRSTQISTRQKTMTMTQRLRSRRKSRGGRVSMSIPRTNERELPNEQCVPRLRRPMRTRTEKPPPRSAAEPKLSLLHR